MESKYNGWTNYATWRINLEFFSEMDWEGTYDVYLDKSREDAVWHIKEDLVSIVDEYIDNSVEGTVNSLVQGWASCFAADCNYHEIAEHIYDEVIDDYKLNNILDEIEDQ